MSIQCLKRAALSEIVKQEDGIFAACLYDATELDRDGEGVDFANLRVREPLTAQVDHDHSVLKTVGQWTGIHVVGRRLRGTMTFAPPGVSDVADQVRRQVEAGVTSTVSIGFLGQPQQAKEGHRVWTNVELLEASFVSVPSSPGARVDAKALRQWLGRDGGGNLIELPDADDEGPVLDVADDVLRWAQQRAARRGRSAAHLIDRDAPTFEIDRGALEAAVCEIVPRLLRDHIRETAQRTLNQMRGRVD